MDKQKADFLGLDRNILSPDPFPGELPPSKATTQLFVDGLLGGLTYIGKFVGGVRWTTRAMGFALLMPDHLSPFACSSALTWTGRAERRFPQLLRRKCHHKSTSHEAPPLALRWLRFFWFDVFVCFMMSGSIYKRFGFRYHLISYLWLHYVWFMSCFSKTVFSRHRNLSRPQSHLATVVKLRLTGLSVCKPLQCAQRQKKSLSIKDSKLGCSKNLSWFSAYPLSK